MSERTAKQPTVEPPGYMGLRRLAKYADSSVNTLRAAIYADPAVALPHIRLGGKILVRVADFDAWMDARRSVGRPQLLRNLKALGLDDLAAGLEA